jgi:rhodanese-related sulfurtransferase
MSPTPARLTPHEVRAGLEDGSILLIDVREPLEFAEARIPGALLFPLSTFEARLLPVTPGRKLIFHCRSGQRSLTAFARAAQAGLIPHGHLEGGIKAWAAAGYAVAVTDPESGARRLADA